MENLTLLEINLIYYENKYDLETNVYKKFKYLNIINEINAKVNTDKRYDHSECTY